MNNVANFKDLSKEELAELVKFGFTRKGFELFKQAFIKAKRGQ